MLFLVPQIMNFVLLFAGSFLTLVIFVFPGHVKNVFSGKWFSNLIQMLSGIQFCQEVECFLTLPYSDFHLGRNSPDCQKSPVGTCIGMKGNHSR